MKRYEYLQCIFARNPRSDERMEIGDIRLYDMKKMSSRLNALGQEGWMALTIHVCELPGSGEATLNHYGIAFFMREIPS